MAAPFQQRLVMQALICFAIMIGLTLITAFYGKEHWSFLVYPAYLITGTVFTTIGVVIADAIRRFAMPDVLIASDGIQLFKAKVFWLIGPQFIGWFIGHMATLGFIGHIPGNSPAEINARALAEAQSRAVISAPVQISPEAAAAAAAARGVPAPAPQTTSANTAAAPAPTVQAISAPQAPAPAAQADAPRDPVQACVDAKTKEALKPNAQGEVILIEEYRVKEWEQACKAAAAAQ